MKKIYKPIIASFIFITIHLLAFSQSNKHWLERNKPYQYKKLYLHTDRNDYFQKDTIWFKAYYLIGQSHQPASGVYTMYTQLIDEAGDIIENAIWPISDGGAMGYLAIPDSLKQGEYLLRAYTDLQMQFGEDAYFHKTIKISKAYSSDQTQIASATGQGKIDVAFLPEGGELLANNNNIVGFAALDHQGQPILIQGKIIDEGGNEITSFNSTYQGLGKLVFNPKKGEKYMAVIDQYPDFQYEFQKIKEHGIKLEFGRVTDDELHFRIRSNTKMYLGSIFYFVIMNKGNIIFNQKFTYAEQILQIKVEQEVLPGGVNRFILLDKNLQPISERLYFSDNFEVNPINIGFDKSNYDTRSLVKLELSDTLRDRKNDFSNVSLAIVDKVAIQNDEPDFDIRSWLLIDSELKGQIRHPSAFFKDDELVSSKEKLDLLMLTHGWSRYSWNEIIEIESESNLDEPEGITLNGKLERYFGKKGRGKTDLEMRIFNKGVFINDKLKSDADGLFTFKDLVFIDTAYLYIEAVNKNKKAVGEVRIDSIFQLEFEISNDYLPSHKTFADISTSFRSKQYYNEKEIWEFEIASGTVLLDEVVVQGKKIVVDDGHFRIYTKPSNSLKVSVADYGYFNVLDYLKGRVAGVNVVGNQVYIWGPSSFSYVPPLFLLDGYAIEQGNLLSIPMESIDVVEVLKGAEAAIYGSRAANGVISVFTKKGIDVYEDYYTPGVLALQIKGYEPYKEFYSPKYTADAINSERPDHRITLYWNPDVILQDGTATMSFYTSDDIGEYKVLVEGITASGKPCLGTAEFFVDNIQEEVE